MLGQSKLLLGFKQLALFGAVLGLVFGTGAVSFDSAFASGKVYVCHNGKDLKINENALQAHLDHGDDEGKCDDDDDDKKGHGKGKFKHVFRGDGPPPDKLGKIGDLYFDTSDGGCMDFWVKIDKKEWEQRGTLCDESLIMIDWSQIDNIPEELLELAALDDCDEGQIIKNESGTWQCADDDKVESLDELLQCADGEIAKFDFANTEWVCAVDEDGADTLEELITCQDDEILRYDDTDDEWKCDVEKVNVVLESLVLDKDDDDGDGTEYTSEGGNPANYAALEPNETFIIQLFCPTGDVSGYSVNTDDAPITIKDEGLVSLSNGEGVQLEVHNHGVTVNDNGDIVQKNIDIIEFVLFCIS